MQVKGAYLPYVTADAHAVRRQDVPLCAATAKDKIKGTCLTTDTLLVAGAGFVLACEVSGVQWSATLFRILAVAAHKGGTNLSRPPLRRRRDRNHTTFGLYFASWLAAVTAIIYTK